MSANPYQPPVTRVGDAPAPVIGRPPYSVMLAIFLICVVVLTDLRDLIRDLRRLDADSLTRLVNLGLDALGTAILMVVVVWLSRRRNLARWVLLAMAALRAVSFCDRVIYSLNLQSETLKVVFELRHFVLACLPPLFLALAAILLLWPARAWFRGP